MSDWRGDIAFPPLAPKERRWDFDVSLGKESLVVGSEWARFLEMKIFYDMQHKLAFNSLIKSFMGYIREPGAARIMERVVKSS